MVILIKQHFTTQQGMIDEPTLLDRGERFLRKSYGRAFQIVAAVALFSVTANAENADAWLHWKNGDALKGTMLSSERGDVIRWKSDLFSDPFDIKISQLKMVRFGVGKKLDDKVGAFRVTLKTGDVVSGDLVSITSDFVTLKSARLQAGKELKIPRKSVASLERMNSPNLLLAGPHSQRGWKSVCRDRKVGDWTPTPEGRLGTRRWHSDLFHSFKHQDKMEVEFTLATHVKSLEFSFGFYLDPAMGPTLETWDDMLVLAYGNDFEPVMKLSSATKNLRFRIFWNKKSGVISVHNADGEKLAELKNVKGAISEQKVKKQTRRRSSIRKGTPRDEGFSLLNKTTVLYFGDFRVRKWNGVLPPKITSQKARIELADGGAIYDPVKTVSGGILKTTKGKSKAIGDVGHIIFDLNPRNPNFPEKPEERDIYVAWLDGTLLSGKLKGLNGETVSVQSPWASEPISAHLGATRKIEFFGSGKAEGDGTDRLIIGKTTLKGRISPGKNNAGNEALVMWLPAGAENASAVKSGVANKVVRMPPKNGVPMLGYGHVYLENNEVLSGKLISIDDKAIHFESEYTGLITLDPKIVRAVDIATTTIELKGFSDRGWEVFPDKAVGKDSVKLEKTSVVLKKGGFGHRSILAGDELKFDAEWKSPYRGAMTLRLFLSELEGDCASTDIVFAAQSNRLYVGETKQGGRFHFSGDQIPLIEGKASIRVVHQGNRLQVFVNDERRLSIAIDASKQSGNGVLFEEGGGWQGFNQNITEMTFTQFEVKRSSGYLATRVINPDSKKEILQIPRFRRDNPASHVLIASNGDLLRGRLIAENGKNIRFSSKLETFDFPRERVSTIIWLKPPLKEDAKPKVEPSFKPTHRFVLHDGSRLNLKAQEINRDRFMGESAVLGKCEFPLRSVLEIQHGPANTSAKNTPLAYSDWILKKAPEPVLPTDDGGESSPLIGQAVKDFKLAMLDGAEFKLRDLKGKVVVLDFWATWCGPCIRAMPEIFEGIGPFGEEIAFLAINQAETAQIIKPFLEQRNWAGIPVGLDTNLKISDQFQVQGIPHTVVIDKDGKIAWIHSGFKEGMGEALGKAIGAALKK